MVRFGIRLPEKNLLTIKQLRLLSESIGGVPDPRSNTHLIHHPLNTIILSAILANICGCDSWEDMAWFVNRRLDQFRLLLDFPNGAPSHDTYRRVFSIIDPSIFERCFENWVIAVVRGSEKQLIEKAHLAIDGKTVRRSHDSANDKLPLHVVSAWSSTFGLVLGQRKTAEKSNEIRAIPDLLETLNIQNTVVSIDAIGCQSNIAEQIIKKGGDYVLALKDNQPVTHQLVKDLFEQSPHSQRSHRFTTTDEKKHGRSEEREYLSTDVLNDNIQTQIRWPSLKSVLRVNSTRLINGKHSIEARHYLSSVPANEIEFTAICIRKHWEIENKVHWTLDMALREDECRKRTKDSAENFALMRKFVLNILKSYQAKSSRKISIKSLRKFCAIDFWHLVDVLSG